MNQRIHLFGVLLCLTFFSACTKKKPVPEIWIYTSIYKNVISDLEKKLNTKFPQVKFQWFQSGSENIAARLNAELSSGRTQADLILTSDPLWYEELKKAGHLYQYVSPATAKVEPRFRDPESFFTTVRLCVGVLAYDPTLIPSPPENWTDLTSPQWKGKISMGSPMESGTAMLIASQLAKKYSWEYFVKLRKNDLLAAGGNSAVVTRLETKERALGILLMENVLEAQKKGATIRISYPKDGTVLVPSPIAILKSSIQLELAKEVHDYFFSDEIQNAILTGRMYSPTLAHKSPEGAIEYEKLIQNTLPWNSEVLEELYQQRELTKKKFMETVLN